MKLIDNIETTLKKELSEDLNAGNTLSVVAASFSIYAFNELRKELKHTDHVRFLFSEPTFTDSMPPKADALHFLPRQNREKTLFGTAFDLNVAETLSLKNVARECANWIKKRASFRSNTTELKMSGFACLNDSSYAPVNGFTTAELGCCKGDYAYTMIEKNGSEIASAYKRLFDSLWGNAALTQDVTETILRRLEEAYKENAPELVYFFALYNVFKEFLDDLSEDNLPNEASGFKESKIWNLLYNFQKDAVLGIIGKLEKYDGCILADSVGLGKTYTALAVVKYYENRNKNVLVLCPKKLAANWNTYKGNYTNNPIAKDRLRYDVLFHTDLNRVRGDSNGIDLSHLNWSNYDLVVIDESHAFRNGGKISGDEEKENRYLKLMNNVIRKGVKTKVLMLSATPVNNRFNDLKNQLALAYEGDASLIDDKLNTVRSIDTIFRSAQSAFSAWSKLPPADRTTDNLVRSLDFDFFEVLDAVTIARSRKHIKRFYDTTAIGNFPKRRKPVSLRPRLTDIKGAISYNDIYELLARLQLTVYTPTHFILDSRRDSYAALFTNTDEVSGFTQENREIGIRRLTAINLMKRMESSVHSFRQTLERMLGHIEVIVKKIEDYNENVESLLLDAAASDEDEFDTEDQNSDIFLAIGKNYRIDLGDMDRASWLSDMYNDCDILRELIARVADIDSEHDKKLQSLLKLIDEKIKHPFNPDNKKLLIFTAFADTAKYLYEQVSAYVQKKYGLNTALVSGSVSGRSTVKALPSDLNTVLTCFSPKSKGKEHLKGRYPYDIDILIATDCISEGQNLQDCDCLINYDIHWNPVRIIQRFGRIDRIGSTNDSIQLVNFWPDVTLDDYINLKAKVETRMKLVDMAATGDDNLLSEDEKTDLAYRKKQLQRLQEEVVDLEDMDTGVSIMDLGLNEYRLELMEYIKHHPEVSRLPLGIYAVAPEADTLTKGFIFVLKAKSDIVANERQSLLHPFYLIYVKDDGTVLFNHLEPKKVLDAFRLLCKGYPEPIAELCSKFNLETHDGKDMSVVSSQLTQAVGSIVKIKEENDLDLFFGGGTPTFLKEPLQGTKDFDIVCFLAVR